MENSISIRKSLGWVGFAQAGKLILQIIGMASMARILPPSDFGLMAIALTVTNFASLFRDFGTGAALIQRKELDSSLLNAVFLFNLIIGVAISISLLVCANWVASFFQEPRLIYVLWAISPVFVVSAFGIVHYSLLERNSNFKILAYIEVSSSTIGLGIALCFALNGGGVYSLVAQAISTMIFSTILLWHNFCWRPSTFGDFGSLKSIWKFSANIFFFNFMNYFHRNADSILIGRYLGMGSLGYYNVGYRILLFPLQNITFVISRASFPVYSRNQGNCQVIGAHYLETLRTIAFFSAPLMAIIWAFREPIIIIFLGYQWLLASKIIAWLAPTGFIQTTTSTSGSLLNSIGRSDILRNLGLIGVPFLVCSIALGLQWGTEGVAKAYCIANLIWIFPVMKAVLGELSLPLFSFLSGISYPALLAAILALVFRQFLSMQFFAQLPTFVQLLSLVPTFLFLYFLFSLPFWPKFMCIRKTRE